MDFRGEHVSSTPKARRPLCQRVDIQRFSGHVKVWWWKQRQETQLSQSQVKCSGGFFHQDGIDGVNLSAVLVHFHDM